MTSDLTSSRFTTDSTQQRHENYFNRDETPQCSSGRLTQAMTRLDPTLREIFLFDYQGYSTAEIALHLNVHQAEVSRKLKMAKANLNKLLF